MSKQTPSLGLTIQHKIATKLVFSKLHAALGGRLRFCISGAAPLDPTIEKFFIGAGVIVLEGLGMTENTSFTNVNRVDNYRVGWVGPPGPGIEQKIDEDGEILYKGRNVMREYYKMPEETAKTFTKDGWLENRRLGGNRRSKLPADHRPQKRPDHYRRRQEHRAIRYRRHISPPPSISTR